MKCFFCIHFFKAGTRLDCTAHEVRRYIPKEKMQFEIKTGGRNGKRKKTKENI